MAWIDEIRQSIQHVCCVVNIGTLSLDKSYIRF